MLDCISGGRLVAGFPVGTPMDTCFAYGQNPSQLRERYHEAHDLILKAWTDARALHLERPLQQAPLRERRGRARCSSRIRRSGSPAAAPSRPGAGAPSATTSTPTSRTSATSSARRRWTASGRRWTRLGKDRNPYRAGFLQFVGVAETRAEAMELYREPAEYFYGRCLHVDPRFAAPPGYSSEATLRARVQSQVAQAAARARERRAASRPRVRGDRRAGLRDHRQPRRGRRAAARGRDRPERRPAHAAAPVRQHGPRAHAPQHRAVREARGAAARATSSTTAGRTAGGRARSPATERARRASCAA